MAVQIVTNKDFAPQLLPCDDKLQAAYFWVATLTEGGRRRCWPRLSPISSINYFYSPTRSTRRNDAATFGQATSRPSKHLRCSYMERGTVSAQIDEVAEALKLIRARTELLPITGAGHELVSRRNRDEISKQVVEAFRLFAYGVAACTETK